MSRKLLEGPIKIVTGIDDIDVSLRLVDSLLEAKLIDRKSRVVEIDETYIVLDYDLNEDLNDFINSQDYTVESVDGETYTFSGDTEDKSNEVDSLEESREENTAPALGNNIQRDHLDPNQVSGSALAGKSDYESQVSKILNGKTKEDLELEDNAVEQEGVIDQVKTLSRPVVKRYSRRSYSRNPEITYNPEGNKDFIELLTSQDIIDLTHWIETSLGCEIHNIISSTDNNEKGYVSKIKGLKLLDNWDNDGIPTRFIEGQLFKDPEGRRFINLYTENGHLTVIVENNPELFDFVEDAGSHVYFGPDRRKVRVVNSSRMFNNSNNNINNMKVRRSYSNRRSYAKFEVYDISEFDDFPTTEAREIASELLGCAVEEVVHLVPSFNYLGEVSEYFEPAEWGIYLDQYTQIGAKRVKDVERKPVSVDGGLATISVWKVEGVELVVFSDPSGVIQVYGCEKNLKVLSADEFEREVDKRSDFTRRNRRSYAKFEVYDVSAYDDPPTTEAKDIAAQLLGCSVGEVVHLVPSFKYLGGKVSEYFEPYEWGSNLEHYTQMGAKRVKDIERKPLTVDDGLVTISIWKVEGVEVVVFTDISGVVAVYGCEGDLKVLGGKMEYEGEIEKKFDFTRSIRRRIRSRNRYSRHHSRRRPYGIEQPLETGAPIARTEEEVMQDQEDAMVYNPINVGSLDSLDVQVEMEPEDIDLIVDSVVEKIKTDSDVAAQVEFALRARRRKYNEELGENPETEEEPEEVETPEGEEEVPAEYTEDVTIEDVTEDDLDNEDIEDNEEDDDKEEDVEVRVETSKYGKRTYSSNISGVNSFRSRQLARMQNFTKHTVSRK